MAPKRSSGLDFSDGNSADVPGTTFDQRNKAERVRLQGLQSTTAPKGRLRHDPTRPKKLGERFSLWLINEGRQRIFFAVFLLLHLIVAALGLVHYGLKDNLVNARKTFGVTFTIARAAALVLHVDVIFILLPVCRNFISIARRTPLGDIIPFDKHITFHKATGWSIVVGSLIHTLAHIVNLYRLTMANTSARTTGQRIGFFFSANFTIGPLITGWLMWICLGVMAFFALKKQRGSKNGGYERFWYTHHLFIPFFILWQLHGMFCMIQPDRPPCELLIQYYWCLLGKFKNLTRNDRRCLSPLQRYWIVGGVIWIIERVLREVRSRHVTYISKVIQHPSDVMELQIKKEKTTPRAGQYIFINCPEISYFQWHPFTLTSAPEEDYISVHIRVIGDFTRALSRAVGCDFESARTKGAAPATEGKVVNSATNPAINRVLPRIMIDGPFGTATEDFLNYETIMLVGAGIGVTPFASILKSIWYRMNNFSHGSRTRLSKVISLGFPPVLYLMPSKVYFTWVIRDFNTAEWFHSLLHALEEQDSQNRIEINIYLTGGVREDDINNIVVQDVGAEKDAITTLRAPTHYGRPNWDKIYTSLGQKHPESDVGVFYCGPKQLASTLRYMSNKHSDPRGARFFFGKENF
ncbi:Superoxide-generating NADPH oxidase heavy chain subunit A [Mycena venus]|uniref:Superoxide-generating NADPH oxidase heavy chain subunit A n=1 Tax=Mycena venus TaxID=2733690 RepID=A0A8H6Z1A2_9AGAR|nr:Superoxide-generating NADPH oxidase heavy chain subunit A [Mycena venus]